MGRFINADALVSTGQGVLGNNMFAYCNNSPVRNDDPNGNEKNDAMRQENCAITLDEGFGAAALVIVGGVFIQGAVIATARLIQEAISDVYAFAKAAIDTLSSTYSNHQPRVHHVIPRGEFFHYGTEIYNMMVVMHKMLTDVGIDINDPQNLIIISHGSHKSMHTKEYIRGIYDIMMQAKGGDEGDVRQALFYARIYAASWDKYSNGW